MSDNTDQKKTNVLDLFCGAGGFSIGLELSKNNYNILGGIDREQDAVDTFNQNHSYSTGLVRDLSEISPQDVEPHFDNAEVDLIIGGPPCKGFSSIRPNRSSDEIDYRNYLYKDYLEFVEYYEPEVFVMENVPQIINHTIEDEKVLDKIEEEITDLDYSFKWRLLNSAYYGVPQARTRFILIGCKDENTEITFPEPTHKFEDKSVESSRLRGREHTVTPKDEKDLKTVVTCTEAISDIPNTSPGETKNEYASTPNNTFQELMRKSGSEVMSEDELTYHIATDHSQDIVDALEHGEYKREEIDYEDRPSSGYSSTYARLYPDEPSTTLTTEYTTAGATRCVHPHKDVPRALTPREGMRIQSFPDWIIFSGPKTSITNQVGNAVPPLLAKAIGDELTSMIPQQKEEDKPKIEAE